MEIHTYDVRSMGSFTWTFGHRIGRMMLETILAIIVIVVAMALAIPFIVELLIRSPMAKMYRRYADWVYQLFNDRGEE